MLSAEPPVETVAPIAELAAATSAAAASHSATPAPTSYATTMPRMPSFAFSFAKSGAKSSTSAGLAKSTPDQLAVYKKNFEAVFLALQVKEEEVAQLKSGLVACPGCAGKLHGDGGKENAAPPHAKAQQQLADAAALLTDDAKGVHLAEEAGPSNDEAAAAPRLAAALRAADIARCAAPPTRP